MYQHLKRVLTLTVVSLFLVPATICTAQLSEGQLTAFVPSESFFGLSINMEKLLENVDKDHEIMKQFRERESASSSDVTESRQMMFMLTTSPDGADEFSLPGVAITRYSDAVDSDEYMKRMKSQGFGQLNFEVEEYKDYELHVGSFGEEDIVVMGDTPCYFFSAEDIVITGNHELLKEMIDSESDDTTGKELVGNLNLDCELHLVMEDGDLLANEPFVQMMVGEIPVPGADFGELVAAVERLEVIADTDQMTPVTATLEMSNEESAEQVEQLINTGLQAVPGLIMMAESSLDDAVEMGAEEVEPIEDLARFMIQLGKTAAEEVEVNRDGSTIEVQLGSIEGLDQLAGKAMLLIAWQTLEMERMMKEFEEMDLDGLGEID